MQAPYPILFTVTSGSSVIVDLRNKNWHYPLSIVCSPGNSGTCEVLSSNAKDSNTNGSALFVDSGNSTMSTAKEIVRYAPCTAIKLKANSASATFEIMM